MVSRGATFIAPLPGTPPVGMSATDGRLALGGIFGTTPQLVSGGVITQSGSNMQFTLAQSVFQLADVTNAAATAFLPTDQIVLTPAAGPGTGSRIDLICVPLKNYENGDGTSQSTPIIVPGVAGTPGVAPAVPAGSYKHAQILVPTSAATASACTVTIFGNSTFAPPLLNTPSFAALSLGSGLPNQRAYSAADQITYRWNGSAWKAWESDYLTYTPVLGANITLGTGGTVVGKYRLVGGVCRSRMEVVFGTGGTIGGSVGTNSITLPPVTIATLRHAFQDFKGSVTLHDVSAQLTYTGALASDNISTTVARIYSRAGGVDASLTTAVPFGAPFAVGDNIEIDVVLEV